MIFNDQEQLTNAYLQIVSEGMKKEASKVPCPCTQGKKCTKKDCHCTKCSKALQEESKKKAKPDYLDVDKDGDKKESIKKAIKDKAMKESSNFKDLFMSIINEEKVCGCTINKGAQYNCITKDGDEKVLKGESVLMMKDKLKSVKPAHKK